MSTDVRREELDRRLERLGVPRRRRAHRSVPYRAGATVGSMIVPCGRYDCELCNPRRRPRRSFDY